MKPPVERGPPRVAFPDPASHGFAIPPVTKPQNAQISLLGRALVVISTAWLIGCASQDVIVRPGVPPALFEHQPVSVQEGKASYYWQPQPTASGERFNPEAMTAAHKTLPFGTTVRATNLKNGNSTIVRINDRGPFIRGRIIDLSRAAAREVNMIKSGVVPIRVEVLKPIEIVDKPNLRLTATARTRGEDLARADAEKPKAKPESTRPPKNARSGNQRRKRM